LFDMRLASPEMYVRVGICSKGRSEKGAGKLDSSPRSGSATY